MLLQLADKEHGTPTMHDLIAFLHMNALAHVQKVTSQANKWTIDSLFELPPAVYIITTSTMSNTSHAFVLRVDASSDHPLVHDNDNTDAFKPTDKSLMWVKFIRKIFRVQSTERYIATPASKKMKST